jgi:hypothetical protein
LKALEESAPLRRLGLYVKAFEITCEVMGGQHPDYDIGLEKLAVYHATGDYESAEPLLDIRRPYQHDLHPRYRAARKFRRLVLLLTD